MNLPSEYQRLKVGTKIHGKESILP